MKKKWEQWMWIPQTLVGCVLFALGFDLFLEPHDMSAGGISGLAMIFVHVFRIGSVGTVSILINLEEDRKALFLGIAPGNAHKLGPAGLVCADTDSGNGAFPGGPLRQRAVRPGAGHGFRCGNLHGRV